MSNEKYTVRAEYTVADDEERPCCDGLPRSSNFGTDLTSRPRVRVVQWVGCDFRTALELEGRLSKVFRSWGGKWWALTIESGDAPQRNVRTAS